MSLEEKIAEKVIRIGVQENTRREAVAEYLKQFIEYPGAAHTPTFETGFDAGFSVGYNTAQINAAMEEAGRWF